MSACHLLIWNSTLKSNSGNLQKQLAWTIISAVRQSINQIHIPQENQQTESTPVGRLLEKKDLLKTGKKANFGG